MTLQYMLLIIWKHWRLSRNENLKMLLNVTSRFPHQWSNKYLLKNNENFYENYVISFYGIFINENEILFSTNEGQKAYYNYHNSWSFPFLFKFCSPRWALTTTARIKQENKILNKGKQKAEKPGHFSKQPSEKMTYWSMCSSLKSLHTMPQDKHYIALSLDRSLVTFSGFQINCQNSATWKQMTSVEGKARCSCLW